MLAIVDTQEFLWISKWRIEHNNIDVILYEGIQLHFFLLDGSFAHSLIHPFIQYLHGRHYTKHRITSDKNRQSLFLRNSQPGRSLLGYLSFLSVIFKVQRIMLCNNTISKSSFFYLTPQQCCLHFTEKETDIKQLRFA